MILKKSAMAAVFVVALSISVVTVAFAGTIKTCSQLRAHQVEHIKGNWKGAAQKEKLASDAAAFKSCKVTGKYRLLNGVYKTGLLKV